MSEQQKTWAERFSAMSHEDRLITIAEDGSTLDALIQEAAREATLPAPKDKPPNVNCLRCEGTGLTFKGERCGCSLAPAPPAPSYMVCINCGEANDGGYLADGIGCEGAVGPFCSQCFQFLREHFSAAPAPPAGETLRRDLAVADDIEVNAYALRSGATTGGTHGE